MAALTQAGLPRVPSLVFSALLVDDDGRMTSAELSGELDVSPASVSGAVRYLAQLGMVRRERERGSRRDVYVVDDDAWHGTMMRRDQLYAPMLAALTAGISALGEDSPVHDRLLLTREFLTLRRRGDGRPRRAVGGTTRRDRPSGAERTVMT